MLPDALQAYTATLTQQYAQTQRAYTVLLAQCQQTAATLGQLGDALAALRTVRAMPPPGRPEELPCP